MSVGRSVRSVRTTTLNPETNRPMLMSFREVNVRSGPILRSLQSGELALARDIYLLFHVLRWTIFKLIGKQLFLIQLQEIQHFLKMQEKEEIGLRDKIIIFMPCYMGSKKIPNCCRSCMCTIGGVFYLLLLLFSVYKLHNISWIFGYIFYLLKQGNKQ